MAAHRAGRLARPAGVAGGFLPDPVRLGLEPFGSCSRPGKATSAGASYLVSVSCRLTAIPVRYPFRLVNSPKISYEGNRVRRRTIGTTNHRTANRQTVKTVMIATTRPGST